MCGIAAIFVYDPSTAKVNREEMARMLGRMKSRGPDGEGEWYSVDASLGLGHRRLSIIDLSENGSQPMCSDDGRAVIVFNGEIYNFKELRRELELKGHHFRSQSDTEVLLHLYQEHGEAMVHKLRGMFAFAIWDETKRGLFLARDPFGIKPLYYADDGKVFRAASQVKALLACGGIGHTPEPAGHVGFFIWGHVPEPYTLHAGIRALPAGSHVWVDARGPHAIKSFCSIRTMLAEAKAPAPVPNAANPRSILHQALLDSVQHHLIADVPVGVFLSAGLDSTTIAALAAEAGGTLRTVTLGFHEFKGTNQDESPLAETVAAQYGAKHQTIWVTRADFQRSYDQLLEAMDQPSIDGVNSYFVSRAATQAGLKVALSGLGGDELLGGYPSFQEIPRAVASFAPLRLLPFVGRSFRYVSAGVLPYFTSPKYAGLLEYGGTYGGAYLLRRGMFMPWELPQVLDEELVRDGWQELQTLSRLEQTVEGIGAPRAKISALEMSWYMRNQLLRDTDWASMAHSLEVRTPLVDVELLRIVAPLLVTDNPPDKLVMSRTPQRALPLEILQRSKTGFSVPVRDWLLDESHQSPNHHRSSADRGLRGWAKEVYTVFASN
jgi:asparagine synthase (glutamine-hydrolysing)